MFGSSATQPLQNPSLFGQTTQPQASSLFSQTTQPQTTSLFGQTAQPQANSLFGQTTQPQSTSLFSTTTQQPPTSSLLGQSHSNTLSTNVTVDSKIKSFSDIQFTTKYCELPVEVSKLIDEFESQMTADIQIKQQLAGDFDEFNNIRKESKILSKKLSNLKSILGKNLVLVNNLKKTVSKEMKTVDQATRFLDKYSNVSVNKQPISSQQFQYNNMYQDDCLSYFFDLTYNLEHRCLEHANFIEELERALNDLINQSYKKISPGVIKEVLTSQNEIFLSLATKIAALHDLVNKQREVYAQFRSRFFNEDKVKFIAREKNLMPGKMDEDKAIPLSVIASQAISESQNVAQQQHQKSGSLFGANVAAPTAGSLFGNSNQTTGLFGNTVSAQQPTSTFGSNLPSNTAALASTSLFGNSLTTNPPFGTFGNSFTSSSTANNFGSNKRPATSKPKPLALSIPGK
ncbi:hypothetical protein HK099_003433 [Clydaea vesicula]|uniref:Nucleoporin p58/p45 n=1 Tax=Clydaea vesicula TaxID=447962 RepID=A0AAD5U3J7_9FUNG|nr:hypothetical protein HK099_003433 [Clydaea vesicula]KAJ3386877.1 hypothetical protein HDU92_002225 [Lobulomyces angularis]